MHKSYYAIIPATVRYDNKLNANSKLLYGEITALCNQSGYCWASNNYFAELYSVSKVTVSRWVKDLIDQGYIRSEIIYKKGTKQIQERRLYLAEAVPPINKNDNSPINKNDNSPINKNDNSPINKNDKGNNTVINNTVINNNNNSLDKSKQVDFKTIIDYLNLKTNRQFNYKAKGNQKYITARINEGYTVEDFKKVIDIKSQEWLNTEMDKFLRPTTLFGNKFDNYLNQEVKQNEGPKGYNGINNEGQLKEKTESGSVFDKFINGELEL